jgi:hypothetical protein
VAAQHQEGQCWFSSPSVASIVELGWVRRAMVLGYCTNAAWVPLTGAVLFSCLGVQMPGCSRRTMWIFKACCAYILFLSIINSSIRPHFVLLSCFVLVSPPRKKKSTVSSQFAQSSSVRVEIQFAVRVI